MISLPHGKSSAGYFENEAIQRGYKEISANIIKLLVSFLVCPRDGMSLSSFSWN